MNERIRELLKQAEERYPRHLAVAVPEVVLRQDALEKFAELIVRECMKIVNAQRDALSADSDNWNDSDFGYDSALDDANITIKQHFGVAE